MFGFFNSQPFYDVTLGEFWRVRSSWRGMLTLSADIVIPLTLFGNRSGPDSQALSFAHNFPQDFQRLRPTTAQALFDHYAPYAEAVACAEALPPANGLPPIASPEDVWPYVSPLCVNIEPLGGVLLVELECDAVWDEEHTLGLRFVDGKFLELCGSV